MAAALLEVSPDRLAAAVAIAALYAGFCALVAYRHRRRRARRIAGAARPAPARRATTA